VDSFSKVKTKITKNDERFSRWTLRDRKLGANF
jgi:hypothetical protein